MGGAGGDAQLREGRLCLIICDYVLYWLHVGLLRAGSVGQVLMRVLLTVVARYVASCGSAVQRSAEVALEVPRLS